MTRVFTVDDETLRGRFQSTMRVRHTLGVFALGTAIGGGGAAHAAVEVTVTPNISVGFEQPFSMFLFVPQAGDPFNAYEVVITFPADLITFDGPAAPTDNEGALMTNVCGQTFLSFTADGDGVGTDTLRVTHALLCAGESVTGPGVLYQFDFVSKDVNGFGDVAVASARFAEGGVEVTPVETGFGRVVVGTITATPEAGAPGLLPPAAPNPFRGSTRLELDVERAGALRAEVFTVSGQRVRTLVERVVSAGERVQVVWDGRNARGAVVAPGAYVLRVRDAAGVRTQRIVRIR